jgi:hypothetical protein
MYQFHTFYHYLAVFIKVVYELYGQPSYSCLQGDLCVQDRTRMGVSVSSEGGFPFCLAVRINLCNVILEKETCDSRARDREAVSVRSYGGLFMRMGVSIYRLSSVTNLSLNCQLCNIVLK